MEFLKRLAPLLLLAGCTIPAPDPVKDVLRNALRTYPSYGRVDDELRLAPTGCLAPTREGPSFLLPSPRRTSASRDETTHGKKEYYLFAKDRFAYLHAKDVDQPDGQVLVKESWFPPKVAEGTSWFDRQKGPLFLMMKADGDWTYATATPDGAEVTASGRLPSCIECHESDRTRDRMFGLTSCAAAK